MEERERSSGDGSSAEQYQNMTRKELYQAARAKGLRGISRCKKAELFAMLTGAAPPGPSVLPGAGQVADVPGSSELSGAGRGAPGTEALEEPPSEVRQEPREVYVDWGDPLPEKYNLDKIGAVAKDPNWIFVHWDLSGNRRHEVAQAYGQEIFTTARWHLRVLDLDRSEYVDLPIDVKVHNWYVPVSEDGTFKVAVGLLAGDGTFIEFASTGEIRTPRSRPSDSVSEEWMVADEQFQRFLKHAGTAAASELSSAELAARFRKKPLQ